MRRCIKCLETISEQTLQACPMTRRCDDCQQIVDMDRAYREEIATLPPRQPSTVLTARQPKFEYTPTLKNKEPRHLTPGDPIHTRKRRERALVEKLDAIHEGTRLAAYSQQEQALIHAYEEYGLEDDRFQRQLFFYIRYLADTRGKAAKLRPKRDPNSKLGRKRVYQVNRLRDSDDHVQELYLALVHPTGNDRGIHGFAGANKLGQPTSIVNWINAVFTRNFGQRFKEDIVEAKKTGPIRIDDGIAGDDSEHRPKNVWDENKIQKNLAHFLVTDDDMPYSPHDPTLSRKIHHIVRNMRGRRPVIAAGCMEGKPRVQIAKETGLHRTTVTTIINGFRDELIEAGANARAVSFGSSTSARRQW